MPKITIAEVLPPDKTGGQELSAECERAISDLIFIQNDRKMYVNERKQLQNLIMDLYEIGYYRFKETALDDIGYELVQ